VNSLNPELDKQVDALAELCCDAIERNVTDSHSRADALIEALVRGGYARISDVNLQTRVEQMAVDKCRNKAIHRRGELTGITSGWQAKFNQLAQWQTQSPNTTSGTKPANISSATDS
jgi:hypothetical protein